MQATERQNRDYLHAGTARLLALDAAIREDFKAPPTPMPRKPRPERLPVAVYFKSQLAATLIARAEARNELEPGTVISKWQGGPAVQARREVAAELRERGWSLPRIGKVLGGRHHTTVLNYLIGKRGMSVTIPAFDPTATDESGIWAI